MNILYLANHLNVGGITSYIFSLAKGLKQQGDSVYVASAGGELQERFLAEGINCVQIPIRTKSELSPKIAVSFFKLLAYLKREQIEIIHANTRVTQVLAFYLERFSGKPYVSTCHGFFKPRLSRKLFPLWGKRAIAISAAVKKHLIADLRVKAELVSMVSNGIDLEKFQLTGKLVKSEAKQALGLGAGLIIGIVARLSDVKGHIYLIEAMREVVKKIPAAQLLIVGEGKTERDLKELSRSLGLEKSVVFIPSIDDTRKALAAMDVFAMPSLNEGLGLGLMEAMATGLAVVGSDVGGISGLIQNGINGILVKPGSVTELAAALLELLQDEGKRKACGENARLFIHGNFPQEKMIAETRKVYEECLSLKK
jgi:L-malate glycosyltransferase